MGSNSIGTPSSPTKWTSSTAYQGVMSDRQNIIPTAQEIEEFFACAEKQQKRSFIEKYNFDIVNDLPHPGCYEWVKVVPYEKPSSFVFPFPATSCLILAARDLEEVTGIAGAL